MAGEVTDPRVKAILLGGGAVAAGAPFVAGAMSNQQRPIDRARASRIARAAPASRGVLGTLGRFSGPVGAAAGMLMPSQLGDGTLQGNEQMLDPTLNRSMFGGQPPQAAGTGITSGLETTPEQEAEMEGTLAEIAGGFQSMNDDIDNAEDYVGIMNAIRGDDQSIEQRRSELAGYIGKEDAGKTPESALTLIQPSLTLLDSAEQGSQEEGGAIADDGIMSMLGELGGQGAMQGAADAMQGGQPMQAPGQGEAIMRMAMGEQPVMRRDGTGQDGEVFSTAGVNQSFPGQMMGGSLVPFQGAGTKTSQEQILANLLGDVPSAKTSAELLPQYQALYGDSAKAYELNPYIAGLQLAGAIANAPKGELLTSILAPETIKAVSDPILQMAQAKGQGDLLAKKAAMEAAAASRSAETKSKQAITVAAIPKMLEREDLITQTLGNTTYVIDPARLRAATEAGQPYTPLSITGEMQDRYQVTSLGEGMYATLDKQSGNVTTGGDRTKDWIKVESKQGDIILYDKSNPQNFKKVQSGGGEIVGDAKDGFVRLVDGKATLLDIEGYNYPGDTTPLLQEAERYGELKGADTLTASETGELEALTAKIMPNFQPTEFQTLMGEYVQNYENTLSDSGLDPAQIGEKVNIFRQSLLKEYIDVKMTKPGAKFDEKAARNKAASTSLVKQLDTAKDIASKANSLSVDAKRILAVDFRGSRFGSTKLAVLEYAKELGITDTVRSVLGEFGLNEGTSLEEFLGGNIESGQVQRALGNAMVVNLAGAFPGNLNQTEIEILQDAAMGIGKNPKANEMLAAALDQIASRQNKIVNGLTDFADNNRDMSDFQLKLNMDKEEIRLTKMLDDPEQNPELKKLLDDFKASGLKGGRDRADQGDDVIPVDVASKYTDTASIENDYAKLQNDYQGIFPDLPPLNSNNNNRQIALQRALKYMQSISQ